MGNHHHIKDDQALRLDQLHTIGIITYTVVSSWQQKHGDPKDDADKASEMNIPQMASRIWDDQWSDNQRMAIFRKWTNANSHSLTTRKHRSKIMVWPEKMKSPQYFWKYFEYKTSNWGSKFLLILMSDDKRIHLKNLIITKRHSSSSDDGYNPENFDTYTSRSIIIKHNHQDNKMSNLLWNMIISQL